MFNKRRKDYLGSLQAIARTEDGKKVLKYLSEDYLEQSIVQATVEHTYYRLGEREFIQRLISDSNADKTELDLTQIITTTYEDPT